MWKFTHRFFKANIRKEACLFLFAISTFPDGSPGMLSAAALRPANVNIFEKRCKNELRCGHRCFGFAGERACPPCLYATCCDYSVKQRMSDTCTICHTETLAEAPVLMLECKHVFHLHCIEAVLQNRWVGPTISFSFTRCPICQSPIKHECLTEILSPIQQLQADVRSKALTRLTFENLHKHDQITKPSGRFYDNPEGFAMERYSYYQCYKCHKAYFGGITECLAEMVTPDPKDLICPSCSNVGRKETCSHHGTDFLAFKCRYCCSIAAYFCFGTTHFCVKCHQTPGMFNHMEKSKLPRCPAGPNGTQLTGECPLKMTHPPTGEEFPLGCGICANTDTF